MRTVRLDVAAAWNVRQIALGYEARCPLLDLVVDAGSYAQLQERIADAMRRYFQRQQRAGRLETTLDRLGATSILCVDSPHEKVTIDAPWTLQFEPLRNRAVRCP
jgi:hypothetical protein